MSELLTTVEAAAYLRLKPATLETWRSTKRDGPPYIKRGRSVAYRRADLEAYITSNTITPSKVTP